MKYQIHISASKNKKYYALLENGKKIHFGDSRYQQYEDKTPQKKYKHLNHRDNQRRELYYKRHGKAEPYSAKYFSHKYLW